MEQCESGFELMAINASGGAAVPGQLVELTDQGGGRSNQTSIETAVGSPPVSEDDDSASDGGLFRAIGRVAVESAVSDENLRLLLNDLTGSDDVKWILFEGQSTEWLLKAVDAVLSHINPPEDELSKSHYSNLRASLKEIGALRNYRNTVVHGTWTQDELPWGPGERTPRPWGKINNQTEWYCMRSRFHKYGPPSVWTVSDVETLANKVRTASISSMRAYARLRRDWFRVDPTAYDPWRHYL
jgi:hypothetical protein